MDSFRSNYHEKYLTGSVWYLAERTHDDLDEEDPSLFGGMSDEVEGYDRMRKAFVRLFGGMQPFNPNLFLPDILEEAINMDPENPDMGRLAYLEHEMASVGLFLDNLTALMKEAPEDFRRVNRLTEPEIAELSKGTKDEKAYTAEEILNEGDN